MRGERWSVKTVRSQRRAGKLAQQRHYDRRVVYVTVPSTLPTTASATDGNYCLVLNAHW